MQHRIGFISGFVGGVGKYLLDIDMNFLHRFMEAGFTAFVCGMLGIAGKEAWILIKKKFKAYVGKSKPRGN